MIDNNVLIESWNSNNCQKYQLKLRVRSKRVLRSKVRFCCHFEVFVEDVVEVTSGGWVEVNPELIEMSLGLICLSYWADDDTSGDTFAGEGSSNGWVGLIAGIGGRVGSPGIKDTYCEPGDGGREYWVF